MPFSQVIHTPVKFDSSTNSRGHVRVLTLERARLYYSSIGAAPKRRAVLQWLGNPQMPPLNSLEQAQAIVDVLNEARGDFVAMAPSMLKKKVVELVFLPWLSAFTARVVRAAKQEERQAILALLAKPAEMPEADPLWHQGHNSALENMRAAILERCDDGP